MPKLFLAQNSLSLTEMFIVHVSPISIYEWNVVLIPYFVILVANVVFQQTSCKNMNISIKMFLSFTYFCSVEVLCATCFLLSLLYCNMKRKVSKKFNIHMDWILFLTFVRKLNSLFAQLFIWTIFWNQIWVCNIIAMPFIWCIYISWPNQYSKN